MFDVVVAPPSSEAATPNNSSDQDKNTDEKRQNVDSNDSTENTSSIRTPQLAFLPTKFRKLVWIKRNDFVIVECGDEDETDDQNNSDKKEGGGFRYVISHILYKDQVKHIKSKGLWPTDSFFDDEQASEEKAQRTRAQDESIKKDEEDDSDGNDDYCGNDNDDGIVFDDPLADEFMVNTNRIAALRVEDSSSDESDD